MKIVEINETDYGSTGMIAKSIANYVSKQGHEANLSFGRAHHTIGVEDFCFTTKIDLLINGLLTRIFDIHGFGPKSNTKKLVQWIDRIKPDIIHLHNLHGYYLNVEVLFNYLKRSKAKIVWTLHDCWPFTGHCSHFSYINCEKWKTGCFSCPLKNEYPASLIFDNSKYNFIKKKELFTCLSSNQLTIVTPSKWLSNLVNESFLSKYNCLVINNGIDLKNFSKKDANAISLNTKKMILGVASKWTELKGFDDFLKLSTILPDNYHIHLVGGLTKKQMKQLETHNISFTQRTENLKELVNLYQNAFCFVNPTHCDNFPTVNIEAQACGTPVITYDAGGSMEDVDPLFDSRLDIGNFKGIVELLNKLNNLDYSKTSKEVLIYSKRFSVENMCSNYYSLFKDVLL